MAEIRQIQVDGVNYDLVISEDEVSATAAAQSAAKALQYRNQAQTSATQAQTQATNASNQANRAEDAADRAEAIVGGQFVSYGQTQGLTDAQKAQARENIGATAFNDNLLDNPWFTVNQRGVNGTITNGQYGLDRWMAGGGTVTMATGGITLGAGNSYALQRPADPSIFNGKTVTLSVMTSDGVIESGTVVAQTGNVKTVRTANFELCIGYTAYNSFYFYNISSSEKTVIAAKLELGSVSTLANDVPPNYDEELVKCKRYFRRITNIGRGRLFIGVGFSGGVEVPNIFGVGNEMRKTTSLTVTYSGSFVVNAGTDIAVTGISRNENNSNFGLSFAASGITPYALYSILGSAGAYIDLSADL